MEARSENLNGVFLFAAGGLIGAGVALLFAPQSGRRTRRDIVHLGKVAKKKSEEVQLEMRRAIDSLVDDISERMQEGMDREYNPRSSAGSQFGEGLYSQGA